MGLVNCAYCGALFHSYSGSRRCPGCIQAEEDALRVVVDYLRDSPARTVGAIADATGIERRQILRWLRTNRLRLRLVPGELDCRRCGKSIEGGSFCDACRVTLAREVAEQRREAGGQARPVREPANPVRNSGRERMYYRNFS